MIEGSARLIDTSHGPARVHEYGMGPRLLVLGHGAGGGVHAADLQAVVAAVAGVDWTVVLVEQPYRVAGRRAPAPVPALDRAFGDIVATLRAPAVSVLVTGGRSSGARVACRTAEAVECDGVVALAFPLRPPGRDADRSAELLAVHRPTLVVQGDRDAFGRPEDLPALAGSSVHAIAGADHAFRARRVDGRSSHECADEVGAVVRDWLQATLT